MTSQTDGRSDCEIDVKKMDDKTPHQIDVEKVTLKAMAVLVMFVISFASMCYIGWMLWTLPPKK